ncbi:MAG: GNAT family N-acetyltransferase [Phycisphaerales bacterium]
MGHDRQSLDVALRAVDPADLPILFDFEREPSGNAMAVANPRSHEAFVQHWQRVLTDPAVVARTIEYEGRVAGSISSFPLDGRPSVGYWLGERYWGRGIASAALGLLLGEIQARPLWARVATTNAASVRVLEKAGFFVHDTVMSEATPRFPACEEFLMRLDGDHDTPHRAARRT